MKDISDHSPISIKMAQLIGKRDLPYRIDKEVSGHPMFARLVSRFFEAAELHLEPLDEAVPLAKGLIQEAACRTREFLLNDKPEERMCILSRLSSIAKCVWKGDYRLACKLISDTELGSKHLTFLNGKPCIKNHELFEFEVAIQRRYLSDKQKEEVLGRKEADGALKQGKKIKLLKIENLSKLWNVEAPRLVLSSVALTPELAAAIGLDGICTNTVGPVQKIAALAAGWGPVFFGASFR